MQRSKTGQPKSPKTKKFLYHTQQCFRKPGLQTEKLKDQSLSLKSRLHHKRTGDNDSQHTAHASASHPAIRRKLRRSINKSKEPIESMQFLVSFQRNSEVDEIHHGQKVPPMDLMNSYAQLACRQQHQKSEKSNQRKNVRMCACNIYHVHLSSTAVRCRKWNLMIRKSHTAKGENSKIRKKKIGRRHFHCC